MRSIYLAVMLIPALALADDPYVADADGDGVVDVRDECRASPRGVTIDDRGCALDSDYDGVAEGVDQCPKTDVGAPVDDRGCTLDQIIEGELPLPDEPIRPRPPLETRAPEIMAPREPGAPEPEALASKDPLKPFVPLPIEPLPELAPPPPAPVEDALPSSTAAVPAAEPSVPSPPPAAPELPSGPSVSPPAALSPPTAPAPTATAPASPPPPPAPAAKAVLFAAGSSELDPESLALLNGWIAELKAALASNSRLRLRVVGFADRRTEPRSGERLAEMRAMLVRSYLIARGLDRQRVVVETRGFGGNAALGSDNRRVELQLEQR